MVPECPEFENWSQLKSFAMGLIDTERYKGVGMLVAGYSTLNDTTLAYYRTDMQIMWAHFMTPEEKRIVLNKYFILRLER